MTDLLWRVYMACGIKYFALLILSFLVVSGCLLRACLAPGALTRRTALLLALIPLSIGIGVTLKGYLSVLQAANVILITPEEIEAGSAESRVSTYFGAALAAPLVLLALAATATRRAPVRRDEPKEAVDGEGE